MNQPSGPDLRRPFFHRPHVVLIGAGASRQAFPSGDRNGRLLPLMRDLVEVLGLGPSLDHAGIHFLHDDFEALYSHITASTHHSALAREIESAVFDYFAAMNLPDEPTLYDHLVLSLRPKDVIASFNWDPFLMQAFDRNRDFAPLPRLLFLHGNVAVGHCFSHSPSTMGPVNTICARCNRPFQPSRLLYPVVNKDYSADQNIRVAWDLLGKFLKDAYVLTIFGYSAPKTDVVAKSMLLRAWGPGIARNYEQIEIIDVLDEDCLRRTWSDFIHTHHFDTYPITGPGYQNFYDSWVARHPRRSCEAVWDQTMEIKYLPLRAYPKYANWDALYNWYAALIQQEVHPLEPL